jgi:hypothetical protein
MTMDEQVQRSVPPEFQQMPKLSADQIEMLKAVARERAIAQAAAEPKEQRIVSPPPSMVAPQPQQQPTIIYLRRNFTVAEIILVVALACGLVTGTQFIWNFGARMLPQIEIKVK